MEDRIGIVTKLVAEFENTLESAEGIIDKTQKIRAEIRLEIDFLMQELKTIDVLSDYIITKRKEIAHGRDIVIRTDLVMTSKQERVEAVLDAVAGVLQDGIPTFSIEDIQRKLQQTNIDLGVTFPPAVIATILAADKRFRKTNMGLYEYIENTQKRRANKQ